MSHLVHFNVNQSGIKLSQDYAGRCFEMLSLFWFLSTVKLWGGDKLVVGGSSLWYCSALWSVVALGEAASVWAEEGWWKSFSYSNLPRFLEHKNLLLQGQRKSIFEFTDFDIIFSFCGYLVCCAQLPCFFVGGSWLFSLAF